MPADKPPGQEDCPSTPTAPPMDLPRLSTGDLEAPLVTGGNSSQGPSRTQSVEASEQDSAGDASLWRNLLARAKGDHDLAAHWMAEVGAALPPAAAAADSVPGVGPGTDVDFDVMAADIGAPDSFFCPISFRVFRDPVLLPTGQTYERRYIERWLSQGNMLCPATGLALHRPVALTSNLAMRKSIEDWAQRNAEWMLGRDGRLKPIPPEDDFAAPQRQCSQPLMDPDLALALRLQEEEMSRARRGRRGRQQQPPDRGTGGPQVTANPMYQQPAWHQQPACPSGHGAHCQRSEANAWEHTYSPFHVTLYACTAAYIVLFIIAMWFGGWSLVPLHENPLGGTSAGPLMRLGALERDRIAGSQHQWWRLLASPFLVAGIIHLFLCDMAVWTFGRSLARVLPHPGLNIPALYMLGAVGGGLVSVNLAPELVAVAAGGGACALVGGAWAEQLINWHVYIRQWVTWPLLVLNAAVLILIGFAPLLNNWLHIAGLVLGFLWATVFCLQDKGGRSQAGKAAVVALQMAAAAAIVGILAVGVVGIQIDRTSVAQDCEWCQDFACLDVPYWTCNSTASAVPPTPNCGVFTFGNGTAALRCPQGASPTVRLSHTPSTTELTSLCAANCQLTADPSAEAPPPDSDGTQRTDIDPPSPPPVTAEPSSPSTPGTGSSPAGTTVVNGTRQTVIG